MVELLVYQTGELPPLLKCQVLSFLRITWPEGFVGENRLRDWITREEHHPTSFVLVEAGLVISYAEMVWKMLEHKGEVYQTYGITGVFTYPSFRGQGYGEQVVRAATEAIARSDADIGMFHCDPTLRAFYARCGWIPMDETVTHFGSRSHPTVSDELMMMQFFSEKGKRGRGAFSKGVVFFDADSTW